MSASRRDTLADMLAAGLLDRVPVDAAACRTMVEQARRHALTAAAGRDLEDFEGAFQLAYDGCRKVCLALVHATGLRPAGEAHHVDTFAAAALIAASFGAQEIVDDAADLRLARAAAQYRAEVISAEEVDDAVVILGELLETVPAEMEKILEATAPG